MTAAEKVRYLIDARGVSYTFLSKKTGISVNAISRSLSGKRRFPADEMVAICSVIGVDLGEFAPSQDDVQSIMYQKVCK